MSSPSIRSGLALLQNRDFARLFTSYLITFTGNAMAPIAMAFGVLDLTGSTSDAAIVIAAPTAAQIFILLFGGVLADRTSRQKVIVLSDSIAAASQLVIATLFLTGFATIGMLAVLMLVNGIAMALHAPAIVGLITQVVDRKDLQSANALLGAARNSAMILGAAFAGILVALTSAGVTIALDGLSFAFSAWLIASLRPRLQIKSEPASIVEELRIGWREFTRHQWLWTIVLQFSLVVAASESVFGLLGPAISKAELGGSVAWGIISAAVGMGTLAGGIISLKLKVKRPMWVAVFLVFLFALTPLALSFPLAVPIIAGFAFIHGIGGQIFGVLWYTTLQNEVPAEMLSRVSAYDHLGSIALAPLGILMFGFLFEAIGGQQSLLIATAMIVIPTTMVLFVPGVRLLRSRDHI